MTMAAMGGHKREKEESRQSSLRLMHFPGVRPSFAKQWDSPPTLPTVRNDRGTPTVLLHPSSYFADFPRGASAPGGVPFSFVVWTARHPGGSPSEKGTRTKANGTRFRERNRFLTLRR